MTHILALTIGIAIGHTITHGRHLRWQEAHHYRAIAASDDRARTLATIADHDHRNALRWKRTVTALQAIHDDVVGDLLDTVATQRHRLATITGPRHLRTPPYSPSTWTYGSKT